MKKSAENNASFIFTAYITLPNGRRIYAKQYGKKAFCIPVSSNKDQN